MVFNPYRNYRDTWVMGSIDHVMQALEDSQMVMLSVTSSRYAAGIREEVERMERTLRLVASTMDEWTACQRQWIYLEQVFAAQDIQRQLPEDSRAFQEVDRTYREIMRQARIKANALKAATTPGWRETLAGANRVMERVLKHVEEYLETKRLAFPRLYFLSNDELLEIMAQLKNVQAIQPYLQNCFDGVKSLDFGDDPASVDIAALVSPEGERLPFGRPLRARGAVEQWLHAVELGMYNLVRRRERWLWVSSDAPLPLPPAAQLMSERLSAGMWLWMASLTPRTRSSSRRALRQAAATYPPSAGLISRARASSVARDVDRAQWLLQHPAQASLPRLKQAVNFA